MISALWVVTEHQISFISGLLFAFPVLLSRWLWHFYEYDVVLQLVANILEILFFGLITLLIIHYVFSVKRVELDTIFGGLSAYLLLGVTFAKIYSLIDTLSPGSFLFIQDLTARGEIETLQLFLYYSFVTLTTLGFADTTPISEMARSVTVIQAVCGQMFFAVLIARLVGIFISQSLLEKQ